MKITKSSIVWILVWVSIVGYTQTDQKAPATEHNSIGFFYEETQDPLFFIKGQLCQHLRKIFEDSKGNLWFATNVYGLMKYDGNQLVYYNKTKGLDIGRITGIVEDQEQNVWFGTYKGLVKYDGNTFIFYTQEDGLLDNEIWSLFLDQTGTFWIGTNQGLSIFDGKQFTHLEVPIPKVQNPNTIYSKDRIVSIVQDVSGAIWLGTDGFGILKYDKKTFTSFTANEGLPDNTIGELMTDHLGNVWIGTYFGGLSKFDGQNFTNFTQKGIICGVEVGSFFEDDQGVIWFSAEHEGVYKYEKGTFTNYGKAQGLESTGILAIYKDRQKRFWLGGWGGLFRKMDQKFTSVTQQGPWEK